MSEEDPHAGGGLETISTGGSDARKCKFAPTRTHSSAHSMLAQDITLQPALTQ